MQTVENSSRISTEIRERMEQYRKKLISAGMIEPTRSDYSTRHWQFYKQATALTAFVVNLRGNDNCLEVMYGYASTAFTRFVGCENALKESGVCDEDITIREKITICNESNERVAKIVIQEMHDKYLLTEKDELLLLAKAKRKEFIHRIAVKLKALGFKKKANTWTKPLEADYYVMFYAQKSAFSDEYYFNIYIGKNGTDYYGDCYYTRVAPDDMYPMDWQAISKEEIDFFLEHSVVPALEQLIETPLNMLGKLPFIWSACDCDRQKCERCWVEKNQWEAKGIQ